jgi:hypothetical protein
LSIRLVPSGRGTKKIIRTEHPYGLFMANDPG